MGRLNVLAATGGGIRGVALAGVLLQGILAGKVPARNPVPGHYVLMADHYDAICGDSSASLILAMFAQGMSAETIFDILAETEFQTLFKPFFMPWALRKNLMAVKPCRLDGMAKWIDRLARVYRWRPLDNFFCNAWDAQNNQHVIFCESIPDWGHDHYDVMGIVFQPGAFSELGWGTVLTRSMTLPGLIADQARWCDGGIAGHPPVNFVPLDANLTVLNLGYPGLLPGKGDQDTGILAKAMECYEVTASYAQRRMLEEFPNRIEINPQIYDVDSTDFAMSEDAKRAMIMRAMRNTATQWAAVQV
ncbi:MAG TPA: hypothetical protein VD994_09220 [Prosthecobacter sp.]|nr:hypothetical protein [Prosthecobacter sp.]